MKKILIFMLFIIMSNVLPVSAAEKDVNKVIYENNFDIEYIDNDKMYYLVTGSNKCDGSVYEGLTIFDKHKIYINTAIAPGVNNHSILVHEVGHVLDYSKNFISNQDKFKEIFNSESSNLLEYSFAGYITERTDEYFAESYAFYIIKPDLLKSICPMTFEFFENEI